MFRDLFLGGLQLRWFYLKPSASMQLLRSGGFVSVRADENTCSGLGRYNMLLSFTRAGGLQLVPTSFYTMIHVSS